MQLTLPTTLVQPSMAASQAPTRGPAAPYREAVAMSQLDRIAAQNLRTPAHGLGATATLLALLGGLVVLGSASMWHGAPGAESRQPQAVALAESRPAPAAVAPVAATAPAVAIEPAVPAWVATPEPTVQVLVTPEAATAALAAADPAPDDAARKARARQQADARRKAAQLAQERALAEETQRLQLAQQQRDAERAQQQLQAEQARQKIAAEQARSQSVQLALDTRRSVSESCSAAGSLISRQFCRSRECSKAEHFGDAVCVNLREDEMARQRASIER